VTAVAIRQLQSRIVYENRWMRVREDAIERRDGSRGVYGVVEKADFVVIVPVDDDRLYLVEQYRYPVRARRWEFPQGSWEHAPGVDPLTVAEAELREETGLRAGAVTHVGHLHSAYGYSTQGFHVFLATDLAAGEPERALEEQDLVARAFGRGEFERMVREGAITDAATVAAYTLVRMREAIGPPPSA
jgi:ADP-ribose pyrophosphatase